MALQISGKHVDLGPALRGHAEDRIRGAVEKYFNGGYDGQVTLEREGSGFKSECTIHLDSGIVLHAEGVAQDAPTSFDLAAERIEKRLRRYKRRRAESRHAS
jgi:ribosomal subunit interface protein